MLFQIVSIRDAKTDTFSNPSYVVSTGVAVRGFVDEVNRPDEQNVLYRHPHDFVLYHLGTYDDQVPKFDQFDIPRQLARGEEVSTSNVQAIRSVQ